MTMTGTKTTIPTCFLSLPESVNTPISFFSLCFVKVTMALQGKEGTISQGLKRSNAYLTSTTVTRSDRGFIFLPLPASILVVALGG